MNKPIIKLPLNCTAEYTEGFLSHDESATIYRELVGPYEIDSKRIKIMVDGKAHYSNFGKLMFLDKELYEAGKFPEEFWGATAVWSEALQGIKDRVQQYAKRVFNVCVCIYYPDGNSGVDYHSDYMAFGDTTVIPSISLGEERRFCLREKESLKVLEIVLRNGSIIVMGENCQEKYEHALPVDPTYKNGRINLTFRQYG